MKKVLMTLIALTLVACVDIEGTDSDHEKDGNGSVGSSDPNDSTQVPSNCGGSQATSPYGKWMASFKDNGVRFTMVFDIRANEIRMTNTCQFPGVRPIQASVTSPIFVDGNTIEIYNSDYDRVEIDENGVQGDCDASLEASVAQYRLKGRCLVLGNGGESLALEPAN